MRFVGEGAVPEADGGRPATFQPPRTVPRDPSIGVLLLIAVRKPV